MGGFPGDFAAQPADLLEEVVWRGEGRDEDVGRERDAVFCEGEGGEEGEKVAGGFGREDVGCGQDSALYTLEADVGASGGGLIEDGVVVKGDHLLDEGGFRDGIERPRRVDNVDDLGLEWMAAIGPRGVVGGDG